MANLLRRAPEFISTLSKMNRVQPRVHVERASHGQGPENVALTLRVESGISTVQRDGAGRPLQSGVYDVRLFRDGQLVGQWPGEESAPTVEQQADAATELQTWR